MTNPIEEALDAIADLLGDVLGALGVDGPPPKTGPLEVARPGIGTKITGGQGNMIGAVSRPQVITANDPFSGWLGTLITHGIVCQSLIAKYLRDHTHISWDLKLTQGGWGDIKTPSSRFAFRFAEFPPPVCFEGRFINSSGSSGAVPGNSWGIFLSLTGSEGRSYYNRVAYAYNEGWRLSKLITKFNAWALDSPDRFKHMYFDKWADYPSRYKGKVKVPAKYKGIESVYFKRLARYYMHGRWLTWAAEMARIHAKMGSPEWWEHHALSWGIGVADQSRREDRKTLLSLQPDIATDETNVKEAMRRIVRLVPPPGSIPSGTELDQSPRRLCDWAVGAEDFAPRWLWPAVQWREGMTAKAAHDAVSHPALRAYLYICGAVMSIAGAAAGGAAGAAVSGAIGGAVGNIAGQIVTKAMRGLMKRANEAFTGRAWDIDSIADLLPADGANLGNLIKRVASKEIDIQTFQTQVKGLQREGWGFGDDLLGDIVDANTMDEYSSFFDA